MTFSVIMPCYNSAAYIKDAVDSIKAQTYPDWELVAVNDGSKDDTLSILESYAKEDGRIKIVSRENGGYASAVNTGLDNISGDYFLFMGSDDRLASDLFEKISVEMGEKYPDIISFRTLKIIDNENAGLDRCTSFSDVLYKETDLSSFDKLYPEYSEIFFIRDTSKIFKKELLGDLRYFGKYGIDADGIFSILFARQAKSFLCVPVDGYYWTLRKDSVSARHYPEHILFDRMLNWYGYFERVDSFNDAELTKHDFVYMRNYCSILLLLWWKIKRSNKETKTLILRSLEQLRRLRKKYENQKDSDRFTALHKLFLKYPKLFLNDFKLLQLFKKYR